MILSVALVGLVIGSLLNVVIDRVPDKETSFFKVPYCPVCGKQFDGIEVVPILGFVLQKGRCRHCHEPIPRQYPLVAAANATLWALVFWRFGFSIQTVVYLIFVSLLLALSVIDIKTKTLPNRMTIPGMMIGLIGRWAMVGNLLDGLSGCIAGLGLLVLVAVISRGGMGLGDAKLMGMIGAFLGWQDGLAALLVGAIIGGAFGAMLLYTRIKRRTDLIAYGPFLALGGIAVVLLRPWLAQLIVWL